MNIHGKYRRKEWIGIPRQTRVYLIGGALVCLILLLLIANPQGFYFLNDDFQHIPLAGSGHFVFAQFLRPVADILFWLDNRVWGKTATGYHWTNLVLHLLNTLVAFFLSRSLFEKYGGSGNPLLKSTAVSLLFLLYGFHSETVFWILGRGGSLGGLFFMMALLAFLDRQKGMASFIISLLFFALGLLSYESTWVYPLVIGIVCLADASSGRSQLKRDIPFIIITLLGFLLYLVLLVPRKALFANEYALHNLINFNPLRLFYNYNTLLARTILPPLHDSRIFLGLYMLILASIIWLLVFWVRKRKGTVLGYLAMGSLLVSLLPEISLGISTHNSESERYIYLPSFFFIIWLIEAGCQHIIRENLRKIILAVLVIGHAWLLSRSAATYRFAGSVVRQSLVAMDEKKEVDTIHVFRLPTQYKGALLFRAGLDDAFHWICPDLQYKKIITRDSMVFLNPVDHYRVLSLDLRAGLKTLGGNMVKEDGTQADILMDGHFFSFRKGRDMILYWTDSALVKIN